MPLYFKKRLGLYASGGDWSDPSIWYDHRNFAVKRVPTANDNVYITGDVSGSGVAKNVTVGTLSQIGGPIFVKKVHGMYTNGGNWQDPTIWYDEYGNQLNRIPTANDDVFINGDVSGSGVANNVVVSGDEYAPLDKQQSASCCCNTPCIVNLSISNCYRITISTPGCDSSWLNGLSTIVRDPSSYCGGPGGGPGLNTARIFYPEAGQEIPDRTVLWQAPYASVGFLFSFYMSLCVFDYIDEQTGQLARGLCGDVGPKITVCARTDGVLYQCANIGAACGSGLHYPWVYSCTDVTDIDPWTGQEYTYQACGFNQSDTPITVLQLQTVVDYVNTETVFPGLNSWFINRYSGCNEGCCNWPEDPNFNFPGWEGCPNQDVCFDAYLVKFEIEAVDCPPKTFTCSSGYMGGGCVEVAGGVDGYSEPGEFATCEECLEVCVARYSCDPIYGCTWLGYGTTGYTQAECAEACTPQSYVCDASGGCQPRYDNSGPLPNCDTCLERFTCEPLTGCTSVGYGTTGYTQTACAEICNVQSYDCTPSGCQQRYDANGALENCDTCLERFTCNSVSGCVSLGFSTTGLTQAACAENCVIQSYVCDQNYGCQPRYDNSGPLANCDTCLERFTCDAISGCISTGYATTGYTQTDCTTNCTVQSYVCESYGCQPRYDNSGPLANCDTCLQRYACYSNISGEENYSYCLATGYGTTGPASMAECCAQGDCAGNVNCNGSMPMMMAPTTTTDLPKAYLVDMPTQTLLEQSPASITVGGSTQDFNFVIDTAAIAAGKIPKPPLNPAIMNDPTGPGTFLSGMLEKIGIKASPNCSCKARAYKMNEMGAEWCAENVPLIVSWLREEAEKRKLPFIDMAGTLLVKRAISLSRAAKKKQAKNGPTETRRSDS